MESLKEETSGLQQDKEVCVYIMVFVVCSLKLFFLFLKQTIFLYNPEKRKGAHGAQQGCK